MNSGDPSLIAGTPRLFAELTPSALLDVHLDRYGFLTPSPQFFGFERLLERPCSLVTAPPWIGKSFMAERITGFLRADLAPEPLTKSHFLHPTNLEARLRGQPLEPNWWTEWQNSGAVATWIIDAVDEGQRKEDGALCPALLRLFDELTPPQRERLRLLLFARESDLQEVAPDFEKGLRRVFGEVFRAELLRLDAQNAKEFLESVHQGGQSFGRVLALIERNSLQAVAGYPTALEYLAKRPSDADVTVSDVWRGVLEQLLDKQPSSRPARFETEVDLRFSTVARIAAALTLSGHDGFADTGGGDLPAWSEIVPSSLPPYLAASPRAAREAFRSAVFRPTPNSGLTFRHKNVQEWMAAFGLSRLSLSRIRPILQDRPADRASPASIRGEFLDLARMLAKVAEEPAVRQWLEMALPAVSSDLFAGNLDDVRTLLDRLERLADRGGRLAWTDDPVHLKRIAVAGVGEELATRLGDASRSSAARIMLLQIGTELARPEVFTAAAKIVPDRSQDEMLRSWCASSLVRSGRADLLRSLVPYVETTTPASREERRLVSTLLRALVEHGEWTVAHSFRYLPNGFAGPVIDSTHLLPGRLAEHMTLEDAADIVASLDRNEIEGLNSAVANSHARSDLTAHPRWETLAAAVKKLALAQPLDPARLRLLHPFVLTLGSEAAHHEHGLISTLAKAYKASTIGRRELFEAIVKSPKGTRPSEAIHHRWWWIIHNLLGPDDLSWLEEHLIELAEESSQVWHIALQVCQQSSDQPLAHRVRSIVQGRAPEALTSYQQVQEQLKEWQREEEERKRKEEAVRKSIADLDREVLSNPSLTPQQRLWRLSWINFSIDSFQPQNVDGSWSDVPEDLQGQILGVCAAALDEVEPTPVPDGSSFPAALQWEAQAFAFVLRLSPQHFPLTQARIRRWLPAVIKTLQTEKYTILNECLTVDPQTAETILLVAVECELRAESAYSILLQDLPAELWTENVARWVEQAIEGEQPAKARANLLRFLAARRPETGVRVARSVLAGRTMEQILPAADGRLVHEPDALGLQALCVLLALAPGEVWPRVEEGAALAGSRFLEKLPGFTHWAQERLAVGWEDWPLERIARLAALLFAGYPPEDDPPEKDSLVRSLGPVDDLRELRWRTLRHLAESKAPDAAATVEAVKQVHPEAQAWLDRFQASREASTVLTGARIPARAITVADACRLLDDEHFRLIRNADDLLEVVVEELARIEDKVGSDLALLYCPEADGKGERRRHEEALQAYVLRRLEDRLPGKVLDRETRVERGKRTDVRVLAQVVGGHEGPAMVVIEVKWSDNGDEKRGVSTGLTEQLGKDYLLESKAKHGIFLVGWNGKLGTWKRSAEPRPLAKTAEALKEALHRQAQQFRRDHPEIDIRPIVWDLRRSIAEPPAVSPRRPPGSKQP